MAKTFNSITAYNSYGIVLNKNEIYCLRLTLHGYNTAEICNFLEINNDKQLSLIKESIMYKLKCTTWHTSILKAFEYNFLNKEDYINDFVKGKALVLSKKIFKNITEATNQNKKSVNYIVIEILDFLINCNKKLLSKDFLGTESCRLNGQLKLTSGKPNYNLLNVLKKVFQQHNIKKEDYCLSKNTEVETIETASRIAFFISKKDNLIAKEKELMVYHEIIKYYTKIEYYYLSQTLL